MSVLFLTHSHFLVCNLIVYSGVLHSRCIQSKSCFPSIHFHITVPKMKLYKSILVLGCEYLDVPSKSAMNQVNIRTRTEKVFFY
mmetsp:Transcript_14992/g.36009  ORF Transcript_14992/g.36009 Transcript_14992/m.36009 type:complete len:84 (-) Transcript_14992:1077-1328(-)